MRTATILILSILTAALLSACGASSFLTGQPSTHTVTYSVSTSNPDSAQFPNIAMIRWSTVANPTVNAESRHALPWVIELPGFEDGAFVSVGARTVDGNRGTLRCEVRMDGQLIVQDDHFGTDVGVGCEGRLPE